MAVQATVTQEQLASATAFIIFSQSLGPAIFLSICNVIFVESLKCQIVKQAPGVDAAAIIQAGATKFRSVISRDDLPAVLVAYANSLDRVFYFVAAAVAVCALPLWGLGWVDFRALNKTKAKDDPILDENKVL